MIDAELLADLRRLVNTLRSPSPEWQRDLVRNVDTDQVRAIVADNRHPIHPAQDPSAKVVPQGAGRVIDGSDAPVASNGTGGWVTPPQVDQWKPEGLSIMDRMMDAQDAIDRLERVKQLGEAKALVQAEAELAKQPEPKEQKGKGK
jgi:hypothetical protein